MSTKAYPAIDERSDQCEMSDKIYQETIVKLKNIKISAPEISEDEIERIKEIRKFLDE